MTKWLWSALSLATLTAVQVKGEGAGHVCQLHVAEDFRKGAVSLQSRVVHAHRPVPCRKQTIVFKRMSERVCALVCSVKGSACPSFDLVCESYLNYNL